MSADTQMGESERRVPCPACDGLGWVGGDEDERACDLCRGDVEVTQAEAEDW